MRTLARCVAPPRCSGGGGGAAAAPAAAPLRRRAALACAAAPLALLLSPPPPCEANGVLFGPRAFAPQSTPSGGVRDPSGSVLAAKAVAPADALAALLDGRDALADAARVRGAQGGKRLRLRERLPAMSAAVQTMTALLPAAVAVGAAAPSAETVGRVLVGARTVVIMDRIGRERVFKDEEIPQADLESAVAAVDEILALLPADSVKAARVERCLRAMGPFSVTGSADDLMEVALTPACAGVGPQAPDSPRDAAL